MPSVARYPCKLHMLRTKVSNMSHAQITSTCVQKGEETKDKVSRSVNLQRALANTRLPAQTNQIRT